MCWLIIPGFKHKDLCLPESLQKKEQQSFDRQGREAKAQFRSKCLYVREGMTFARNIWDHRIAYFLKEYLPHWIKLRFFLLDIKNWVTTRQNIWMKQLEKPHPLCMLDG